jgi:acyl-CoA thioester hydrolase
MNVYTHRVLYGDTDQMGVVYYANYMRFFEGARNEWIRNLGIPYSEIEDRGYMLPVYEAGLHYLKPAKYDDVLEIPLVVTHTRVKIRFEYKVKRHGSDELLVVGHTVHVVVGKKEGKPTRAPDWLVQALQRGTSNG